MLLALIFLAFSVIEIVVGAGKALAFALVVVVVVVVVVEVEKRRVIVNIIRPRYLLRINLIFALARTSVVVYIVRTRVVFLCKLRINTCPNITLAAASSKSSGVNSRTRVHRIPQAVSWCTR